MNCVFDFGPRSSPFIGHRNIVFRTSPRMHQNLSNLNPDAIPIFPAVNASSRSAHPISFRRKRFPFSLALRRPSSLSSLPMEFAPKKTSFRNIHFDEPAVPLTCFFSSGLLLLAKHAQEKHRTTPKRSKYKPLTSGIHVPKTRNFVTMSPQPLVFVFSNA